MDYIIKILIAAYSFTFSNIENGTANDDLCKMFNEIVQGVNKKEFLERIQFDNKPVMKFLKCDFDYTSAYWNVLDSINNGYVKVKLAVPKKEKFFFKQDGLIGKKDTLSSEKLTEGTLIFNRRIRSLSGVEIYNSDNGVILRRGKKSIDLGDALKKYFNKNSIFIEFQRISSGPGKYSARCFEHLLHQVNNPPINFNDYNRLKDSEILALWCLIPQHVEIRDWKGNSGIREVERHLVGLARGKNKQLFHWNLDLGKDISVLMQYATLNAN